MKSHTISVTVDNNSIRVDPDTLVMTTSDEAKWAGTNDRQFSIEFENDGPFGNRRLAHAQATTGRQAGVRGRFKYSVVSEENPSLRLDPVIIVDPPPTHSE